MKKKLLLITFCLLTMFVFLGNVNALESGQVLYSSNPYEKRDDGFDKCIKSGYKARECVEKCTNASYDMVINFDSFLEVLEDPFNLGKDCGNSGNTSILCPKDFDSDEEYSPEGIDKTVSKKDLRKSSGWTLWNKKDDLLCWIKTAKKDKGVLSEPSGSCNYVHVMKHPSDDNKALVCKSDDANYFFECDMHGYGSDFRLYLDGTDYGPLRNFNMVYDPEGVEGWFDAVIQKIIDVLSKETGSTIGGAPITKSVKVCMDPNTANAENLIDSNSVFDAARFEGVGGCIDFGKQTFTITRHEGAPMLSTNNCYSFLHKATGSKPFYNTTVWTKANLNGRCGLKLEGTWDRDACKNADLTKLHKVDYGRVVEEATDCKGKETHHKEGEIHKCYRTVQITNSGYNGVPSFYDVNNTEDELETECKNFQGLHIIYRVIIISAPILVIFLLVPFF